VIAHARRFAPIAVAAVLSFAQLAGCGGGGGGGTPSTPTPTPFPTTGPTSAPTASPSPKPTPTVTPVPTATPVPTPTPTAAPPTPTPAPLLLSPTSLSFTATGQPAQSATVSQAGYTGSFGVQNTCSGIATTTFTPTTVDGPSVVVSAQPVAAGVCTVIFTSGTQSQTLTITVTTTTVGGETSKGNRK